jgi:hypothetical protein
MAAKRPTNTIRLVTQRLTERQVRALSALSWWNVTVPTLAQMQGIIPPSARKDLEEALYIIRKACALRAKQSNIALPSIMC